MSSYPGHIIDVPSQHCSTFDDIQSNFKEFSTTSTTSNLLMEIHPTLTTFSSSARQEILMKTFWPWCKWRSEHQNEGDVDHLQSTLFARCTNERISLALASAVRLSIYISQSWKLKRVHRVSTPSFLLYIPVARRHTEARLMAINQFFITINLKRSRHFLEKSHF